MLLWLDCCWFSCLLVLAIIIAITNKLPLSAQYNTERVARAQWTREVWELKLNWPELMRRQWLVLISLLLLLFLILSCHSKHTHSQMGAIHASRKTITLHAANQRSLARFLGAQSWLKPLNGLGVGADAGEIDKWMSLSMCGCCCAGNKCWLATLGHNLCVRETVYWSCRQHQLSEKPATHQEEV